MPGPPSQPVDLRPTLLRTACCLLLLAVAPAGGAKGAPELAVDLDPDADGVQGARTLEPGDSLTVEVPVDAGGEALNGFQLELRFDPAVLQASSVEAAGFLAAPTRVLQSEVEEGEARVAAVTLGDDSVAGQGVLARVHFDALAAGETALQLGEVRLPRVFGEPVLPGAAEPATVVVVPEPAAAVACLGALGALAALSRRAARRRRRDGSRPSATGPAWRTKALPGLAVLAVLVSGAAARAMPDANADGFVDVLDASLVSSCLGVDPASDPTCAPADVDGDGDVDAADLDAVAAAFGEDPGPPYRLPGRLFDCERDGFPCSLADVPLETVRRMDAVLGDAAERLEDGDSLEEVEESIAGLPDADRCFREENTVVCRLQGARPMVIHDGAEARDVGGTPVGPFVPSVGEFPAGRGPVGQRVVGRDRDEDGRRDREKRAIVLSPFALDFGDADSAPLVRDSLDSSTPYADFPDYDGRIVYKENADVGVADFLELDDFDVVFVSTHGDSITGERNGARVPFEVLFLEAAFGTGTDDDSVDATCEAARELTEPPGVETGREIVCGVLSVGDDDPEWVPSIAATPEFFGRLYPQGLRNALIYLDACRTYRTQGLLSALMGTHSVFFGWDDYVPSYLSYNAALGVFDRSARLGMRLSRAWQLTCSEDGTCLEPLDPGDPSSDGNDKAAELDFAFDGADQRLREVLTILDPETMQPADGDGEVLVERFAGVLGDGLEGDLLGFFVELEGFEAEDLALRPPQDWLAEMTWFSADRDGVEVQGRMDGGSLQPLGLLTSEQGLLAPVGDPDEYRWRSTQIVGVALKEDLEPGEQLVIDPKLIFPPTEGRPPSFVPEDGYSYARTYEHTVGACSFDAQVGGGSFSGTWAVVQTDAGEWELEMQDLSDLASAPGARFNAQLDASAVGSQPGGVERLTVKVPGGPFSLQSYRWTPGIGADEGLPAPTVQSVADGERVTGSIQGSVVDESVDPPDVQSVSITFDADLYLDEPPEFPCVR